MRRSPKSPLIVSYADGKLTVDLFIAYNGKALVEDQQALQFEPSGITEKNRRFESAADWIERGIRDRWSGKYPLTPAMKQLLEELYPDTYRDTGQEYLELDVKLSRHERKNMPRLAVLGNRLKGKRRPARVYYSFSLLPAHVASAYWRRFWGIFRTGQIESIGFNWSPDYPGYMVMPNRYNDQRIARIAPHEAGHLFGLGDAYDAWYRFYYYAPGTEDYMMRSNRHVHPEEVEMLLRAQLEGKMQSFPRKFKIKNITAGWKRAFVRKFGQRKV